MTLLYLLWVIPHRVKKFVNCEYINENIVNMDVDLLRPGTVPISPDTILWFEFLLNPSLLQKHLSKPFPGKYICMKYYIYNEILYDIK